MTIAIMRNPRHSRVYLDYAAKIAHNELTHLQPNAEDVREAIIGGVPYILFEAEALTIADIQQLSRLSFAYAIFEARGVLLAPIVRAPSYFIDEDISAILKYAGKTNELFTRLMLNLSLAHPRGRTINAANNITNGSQHQPNTATIKINAII